jgi:hypothetical protein
MTRLKTASAVALGFLMLTMAFAGPAAAFTYVNVAGFTLGSESSTSGAGTGISFFGPVGEGAPVIPGSQFSTIGWGNQPGASFTTSTDPTTQTGPTTADARSALRVTGISGTINPGETKPIAIVTHWNRLIFIPFLTDVDIDSRLTISNGGPFLTSFVSNHVNFTETPNVPPCDPATHVPSTDPCSDFFLFPLGDFAPIGFSEGGNNYVLVFSLVPLGDTIFEPVIANCDGSPGVEECGRIRTPENQVNDFRVDMTLVLIPSETPAPASLVLLGLSLVGVGLVTRRRMASR